MAIYTKTGDKGQTSLFDGTRVAKNSPRVNAYGTLDELNAHLSVCEKICLYGPSRDLLHQWQDQLFHLSAEVATVKEDKKKRLGTLITEAHIKAAEQVIDEYTAALPPVHAFIMDGNCLSAAQLHVARTICRRAERALLDLAGQEELRPVVGQYINRLSDGLYILARMEDFQFMIEKTVHAVKQALRTEERMLSVDADNDDGLWERAQELCCRARKAACKVGVPVVISVVDTAGQLILLYRMKDALLISSEISPNKAYTAVALKCPTHELTDAVQPGADLYQLEGMVQRRIVTFGGGFPLYKEGRLIGGFGISGGTVQEDMTIARVALGENTI